jgi:hypothetical protein
MKAHYQRKWSDGGSEISDAIDDSTDKGRNTLIDTGTLWRTDLPVIRYRNAQKDGDESANV